MIYQHATNFRDKSIAQGLGKLLTQRGTTVIPGDLAREWPMGSNPRRTRRPNGTLTSDSGRR